QESERQACAGRALLDGREPVPAPALPGRRRRLSRRRAQLRERREGARLAAAARPVTCRDRAEGNGLRLAWRGAAQIPARLRQGEERHRHRAETDTLLRLIPPPKGEGGSREHCEARVGWGPWSTETPPTRLALRARHPPRCAGRDKAAS